MSFKNRYQNAMWSLRIKLKIFTILSRCYFCCYDKLLTKTNMGRKGFIWLIGSVSQERKPSKEIKEVTEETTEEHYLLTWSPGLAQPWKPIFLQPSPTQLGVEPPSVDWVLPQSIINQENSIQTHPQNNPVDMFSQLSSFFPNVF